MTCVVSVAAEWQRTDSSWGTKQTVDRSIKRYQRSKSTSWKTSLRKPPASNASRFRNITQVGSPIQLPFAPRSAICPTNDGPWLRS
jgi:hypothetical protein